MGSWAEEMIERGLQKGLEKGLEKGLRQGLTQARAEYILRTLTARRVHVDEAARQRILSCTDVATLDRWFDRAINATTLGDVLDDPTQ